MSRQPFDWKSTAWNEYNGTRAKTRHEGGTGVMEGCVLVNVWVEWNNEENFSLPIDQKEPVITLFVWVLPMFDVIEKYWTELKEKQTKIIFSFWIDYEQ